MKKLFIILVLLCSVAQAAIQRFGIFSPVDGIREDIPYITMPEALTPDNENVLLRYGEIQRASMRGDELLNSASPALKTKTPDDNPIMCYHWFEKSDDTDYLLGFTKDNVYNWDTVGKEWDVIFTCGSDAESWSVVTINDWVFATNNYDKIQRWNGTGSFADAGIVGSGLNTGSAIYLTKAKFLVSFCNYLLACNVQVGGSLYPQDIYWSDFNDPNTFTGGNASSATIPGPDPLVAAAQLNDFLIIFTGRSIDALWNVDSTLIFNSRRIHNSMGTYSPGSVVRDTNENLYFIDNHKKIQAIKSVMADFTMVSAPIDKTLKIIQDSLLKGIRSTYIWDYDQIWWAIPYGPDATGNNKVVCVNPSGSWTRLDMAVSAFGTYENKVTYTWATLPYPTWLDWDWDSWRAADTGADYRRDLCADYSGYTYGSHYSGLDSDDVYTGYAVLGTDFSQQKGTQAALYYKRLLKMTLIFRREAGGTAEIGLKRDFESTWQSVGSVSLAGDTEILWTELNCDYRARYFWLKISADNDFRFIGVVFHYVPEGTR